jgi:hypothetical protein
MRPCHPDQWAPNGHSLCTQPSRLANPAQCARCPAASCLTPCPMRQCGRHIRRTSAAMPTHAGSKLKVPTCLRHRSCLALLTACQQDLCMRRRSPLAPAPKYKGTPRLGSRRRQRSLPGGPCASRALWIAQNHVCRLANRVLFTHHSLAEDAVYEMALAARREAATELQRAVEVHKRELRHACGHYSRAQAARINACWSSGHGSQKAHSCLQALTDGDHAAPQLQP